MANPLDSNIRHSHTFSTRDLTQGQIPGANPSRLLALPVEILDVITRRISSGGTLQENAANAIAWGRVAVLPHITTQALHVEHVLDKAKYSKHSDEALVVLWQCGIAPQLRKRAPEITPEITTAREIREWMADPNNTALLNTITEINLSHAAPGEARSHNILRQDIIAFSILPPEVNRLKVIPLEINALTNLTELRLQYNRITQISPRAFTGCPHLRLLELNHNQITQIDHEAFTGCQALDTLRLSRNQITQIDHRTFVGCPNLYQLDLGHNQIAQIDPRTFVGLLVLRFLTIHTNRITQIDSQTFAGCPCLYFLSLSNNQITHVDVRTFADHPFLTNLSLSNNQITYIDPRTFANCPILEDLYLCNHSLLCTLNSRDMNHLSIFHEFSRYVCRSPWAAFYKALSEGSAAMSDAAELVKGLEDRNLIYEMVYWEARDTAEQEGRAFDTGGDLQWGENHVCDDKAIFCRALKRAVQEKFNRLSAEQKCAVHGAIYRIAREEAFLPLDSPEWNDPDWGKNNREDNVLMFIDAMQGF